MIITIKLQDELLVPDQHFNSFEILQFNCEPNHNYNLCEWKTLGKRCHLPGRSEENQDEDSWAEINLKPKIIYAKHTCTPTHLDTRFYHLIMYIIKVKE